MNLATLAENSIGLDLSNRENEYGCVETFWTWCKLLGIPFKEKFSTRRAYTEFLNSDIWEEKINPKPGDVIITPTINYSERGHIGTFLYDMTIASNNSYTFKVNNHISNHSAWMKQYKGMTTKIFRLKQDKEIKDLSQCLMELEDYKQTNKSILDFISSKLDKIIKKHE